MCVRCYVQRVYVGYICILVSLSLRQVRMQIPSSPVSTWRYICAVCCSGLYNTQCLSQYYTIAVRARDICVWVWVWVWVCVVCCILIMAVPTSAVGFDEGKSLGFPPTATPSPQASNSVSYVQDALQLLKPVLQYTVLQKVALQQPGPNVHSRS